MRDLSVHCKLLVPLLLLIADIAVLWSGQMQRRQVISAFDDALGSA